MLFEFTAILDLWRREIKFTAELHEKVKCCKDCKHDTHRYYYAYFWDCSSSKLSASGFDTATNQECENLICTHPGENATCTEEGAVVAVTPTW